MAPSSVSTCPRARSVPRRNNSTANVGFEVCRCSMRSLPSSRTTISGRSIRLRSRRYSPSSGVVVAGLPPSASMTLWAILAGDFPSERICVHSTAACCWSRLKLCRARTVLPTTGATDHNVGSSVAGDRRFEYVSRNVHRSVAMEEPIREKRLAHPVFHLIVFVYPPFLEVNRIVNSSSSKSSSSVLLATAATPTEP